MLVASEWKLIWPSKTKLVKCIHIWYSYEGCSKFFHLENVIFAKKKFFRRTFANSMFFFRGTCWRRFLRKTWMCDILKLFQASDPSSHFILRQLRLNIYVLLVDVGPCSPSWVSSDTTSPQFRPPSLPMKVVFRQGFSKTFAKLSRKIPQ